MKKSVLLLFVTCLLEFAGNISVAQSPTWLWAKRAGGTGSDCGTSVALDASGNTYVAGCFSSPTITFGSDTLTNDGFVDIFLVKYNANGNVIWAKSAGGTDRDEVWSVAVDASGNACITGEFFSSIIIFGSDTLTNMSWYAADFFLAKYDANGNVLWAKRAGGQSGEEGTHVAIDLSGNVYAVGWFFSPSITFDSFILTNAGLTNTFIVKYESNGNVLWAKSAGGLGQDCGLSIAVDLSQNVYITGDFGSNTMTIGTFTLTNSGWDDIFTVKYDANGNVLWAKSAGGSNIDLGVSIVPDDSGNVYVTGLFSSTSITVGNITLTNAGGIDMFILKYDANGDVLWAKSAGGTGDDRAECVAMVVWGNPFLTGSFNSPTITFDTCTLASAGGSDIFLVKFDASGNVLWAKSAGGTSDDGAFSVAADASGDAYLTGYFDSSTITFGSDTLLNTGSENMFLVKSGIGSVGVSKVDNLENISVYPNPANDKITVRIPVEISESNIVITDIEGKEMIQKKIKGSTVTIDVSDIPLGVYFLKFTNEHRFS